MGSAFLGNLGRGVLLQRLDEGFGIVDMPFNLFPMIIVLR